MIQYFFVIDVSHFEVLKCEAAKLEDFPKERLNRIKLNNVHTIYQMFFKFEAAYSA